MSTASSSPVVLAYAAPVRRGKPAVWPVYLLIGLTIGLSHSVSIVISAVLRWLIIEGVVPLPRMVELVRSPGFGLAMEALDLTVKVLTFLPFVLFSWRRWRFRLELRRPAGGLWALAVLGLMPLAADVICSTWLKASGWESAYHQWAHAYIFRMERYAPVSSFLLAVLAHPLYFCLAFLGFVQSRLVRRHGVIAGLLITSAAAAFASRRWTNGLEMFVLAFLLGAIAYRTGSILSSLWALMVLSMAAYTAMLLRLNASYTSTPAVIGAVVVLIVGGWVLVKVRRPVPAYLRG